MAISYVNRRASWIWILYLESFFLHLLEMIYQINISELWNLINFLRVLKVIGC